MIGLHGQWGSGKSTAINFILAHITKHNQENEADAIIHIDFRPWLISGHQDLIAGFFKLLSEHVAPETSSGRLARRLATVADGTTASLVDAAATIALTIDPTGGAASTFAGDVAKKGVQSAVAGYLKTPSLQTTYENLRKLLEVTKQRFLITIDDVDRLNDDEVRTIMQMAKSIGRLPNVVYLLSYDREIVGRILDQDTGRKGPRFSEKIIQQEVELPRLQREALLSILDREIAFVDYTPSDTSRWHYIVRDGIHRWIRTPRDVVRLSNAVKFSWPALAGEIDAHDLIAMEGLRLFDPVVFDWIRENRDLIFREGRFLMADDDDGKAAIGELKARLKDDGEQILAIVAVLLPSLSKWMGNNWLNEAPDGPVIRRGVGSEDGYDAYFALHAPSHVISKVVIDRLVEQPATADQIEGVFNGYLGRTSRYGYPMIARLLEELRIRFRANRPPLPTQSLLDALFRIGEAVLSLEHDGSTFQLSPRAQIAFLVQNMLKDWEIRDAGSHLIEAFEKAPSVSFMAEIYVDRGRELQVFPSSSSPERPVIDEVDFNRLGEILLTRIRNADADGTLSSAPFYFDIVRAWMHLAGADEPKAWLSAGMAGSAKFFVKVARGMVSYSIGERVRAYALKEAPETALYDLPRLNSFATQHLNDPSLTADQRNLVEAIRRGTQRLLDGKLPEQYPGDLLDD